MDTKTDRELIELAAKANNIKLTYGWINKYGETLYKDVPRLGARPWRPIDDDSQAFRLAIDLGLFGTPTLSHYISVLSFIAGYDKYTLMRRAIVMAAAKIGEGME